MLPNNPTKEATPGRELIAECLPSHPFRVIVNITAEEEVFTRRNTSLALVYLFFEEIYFSAMLSWKCYRGYPDQAQAPLNCQGVRSARRLSRFRGPHASL